MFISYRSVTGVNLMASISSMKLQVGSSIDMPAIALVPYLL